MNVAIIPARGGSKGLPRKNVLPLAGKPLIVWSIEQALASSSIDRVIVSTDDQEIGRISELAGAEVIQRPADISGDEASSESALRHVLDTLAEQGDAPDNVVFLQCTSPIRPPGCIDRAFEAYALKGADSLLSVTECHRFFWKLSNDGYGEPQNYDPLHRPRRQEMDNAYQENGSLYIFSRALFDESGSRLGGKIALYVMEDPTSYEIDSPTDFAIVEMLMKQTGAAECS